MAYVNSWAIIFSERTPMQLATLRKHIGNIVTLDLVNGKDFTARITEVDVATMRVKCSKPLMFVPVQTPEGMQVQPVNYGYPLYKSEDEIWIDSAHVVMVLIPSPEQIDHYTKKTGSIMTATTLHGLDLSGMAGSR